MLCDIPFIAMCSFPLLYICFFNLFLFSYRYQKSSQEEQMLEFEYLMHDINSPFAPSSKKSSGKQNDSSSSSSLRGVSLMTGMTESGIHTLPA
jgi:hypothetical protein